MFRELVLVHIHSERTWTVVYILYVATDNVRRKYGYLVSCWGLDDQRREAEAKAPRSTVYTPCVLGFTFG